MSEDTTGLETVLVGVGGRDEDRVDALADAVTEIASPSDSRIVLAVEFDRSSYKDTVEKFIEADGEDITPDELASRMQVTREIADRLDEASLKYESRAADGTNGEGVVDIAEEEDADLVVVGGRQRSPTGKALFGSMAQQVMLQAPCPVTFVRDAE